MPYITYPTPHGLAWIAYSGDSPDATGLPGSPLPADVLDDAPPVQIAELARRLEAYWAGRGELPVPAPEMIERGAETDLRARIYTTVSTIPPGATMTYREVAEVVGVVGGARAVGAAMAANRFAPVIPCHRVVGSDGSLRGYAGGVAMKRHLLEMEASHGC